ncbi:MAG TPA: hypothetical protein VK699_15155 [Terriglobales bacterium]|nr:hypothetical protein [Terriglobales bacterium]
MKKIMFAIALTLALTAGIASPISAAAQTKQASPKANPITDVNHDGPGAPPCQLTNDCFI